VTSPAASWQFEYERSPTLPVLAWVARIHRLVVTVRCGLSVRIGDQGFFEGTWAGPPRLESVARQETVFGSGIVLDGRDLVVVPPSHTIEPLYLAHAADDALVVSNSLIGLLVATGRELTADASYPPIFGQINRGLSHASFDVPTTSNPISVQYFENLLVNVDGSTTVRPKPRGGPLTDFGSYRDLLVETVRSSFENASQYVPAVSMSRGYDSTAAGAVAAQAGCRHVLSFSTGWPWAGFRGEADTPDASATALGMDVETYDRLAYMDCGDAPEAEFLATGMSGEDVIYRSMETDLKRRVLVTGFWGGAAWRGNGRANMMRTDLSGTSMGEFRMRLDMIHLPLPYIRGLQQPSLAALRLSREMRPYRVGGVYDEPVARRLAEEAGVPRGSFATEKLAASQRIHTFGLEALSVSGREAFEAFAGADALASLPRKAVISRRHRVAMKAAHAVRADWAVAGLIERRFRGVHIEPVLGSLLVRWAVEELKPRYAELAPPIRS
jgi:hypothetical protein